MAVELDERHAIFLGPGEGEELAGRRRELRVKYEGDEARDARVLVRARVRAASSPHVHETHTDSFYVLEGEVEFTLGDETIRAGPGTFVAAPPGVRHGFAIPRPATARFLNIHAPGSGFIDCAAARRLICMNPRDALRRDLRRPGRRGDPERTSSAR